MRKIVLFAVFVVVLVGCKKEDENDIQVKNPNIEVKAGSSIQIEATSSSPITYFTENEFYASVNSTGLITANRVGEVSILLDNSEKNARVQVKILPVFTTYQDPYLNFGASKDDVIKSVGSPSRTNDDGDLIYDNYSTAATLAMYFFNGSKLESVGVAVKTSYATELGNFIRERYSQYLVDGYDIYYINSLNINTATMIVGVRINISALMVVYMPTETLSLRSSEVNVKKFTDTFKKIVQ